MQITEVRIKLMDDAADRLRAFCSITIDDAFVVRDLKIIDGATGPFVAMPSRKLTGHCSQCRSKNHLRALYCNQCGARQQIHRAARDDEGRARLYADIAHPINSECREMIQAKVLETYQQELELAKQPGYVSRYDDMDDDFDAKDSSESGIAASDIATKKPADGGAPPESAAPRPGSENIGKIPPAPPVAEKTADAGSKDSARPPSSPPAPHKKPSDDMAAPTGDGDKPADGEKTSRRNPPKSDFGAGIF